VKKAFLAERELISTPDIECSSSDEVTSALSLSPPITLVVTISVEESLLLFLRLSECLDSATLLSSLDVALTL